MRLITDVPVPGRGEVLIRVAAAGVNFADISKAYGTFLGGPRPPYLAGFEAVGEIVAVGDAVTGPQPGARVVGVGDGAFAEYMVLPAAAAVPVPPGWTEQQALGLVVNWPAALAALRPLGGIAAGQTVLIHAAAGATGQAAVTMAKHYGATVIATNVCLTALEPRRIRVLPSGLTDPSNGPDRPPSPVAPGEVSWLEPLPDGWIAPADDDPAAVVVVRESLRLALIASLQHLSARQRAILILREVLAFSAAETAEILDTTTAAVKSGLQRARARLDELEPEPEELLEPTDQPGTRATRRLPRGLRALRRRPAGTLALQAGGGGFQGELLVDGQVVANVGGVGEGCRS